MTAAGSAGAGSSGETSTSSVGRGVTVRRTLAGRAPEAASASATAARIRSREGIGAMPSASADAATRSRWCSRRPTRPPSARIVSNSPSPHRTAGSSMDRAAAPGGTSAPSSQTALPGGAALTRRWR